MNAICRWIGYALLAATLYAIWNATGLCQIDLKEVIREWFYAGVFMAGGIAAVALVGMERELWSACRAWCLGENELPRNAAAMERLCDLSHKSTWLFGVLGGTIFVFVFLFVDVSPRDYDKHTNLMIAPMMLLYAPVVSAFFLAHRTRARRWLAERACPNPGQ